MKILTRILALATVAAFAACDDAGTGPAGTVPLSLSVSVAPSAAPTAQSTMVPLALAETFDDGTNQLELTRVALVIEELELESILDDECDDFGDDDDCEEFEAGPFLLELPLDGSVDQVVSVDVRPGSYDEIEFEIDVPDDDESDDVAFLQNYPEFEDISVRVEGTWNGESFVFTADIDAEQELELAEPLVVEEGAGPMNLTLSVDVSGWFVDGSGNLIDPRTANDDGENEDLVEDNIERSLDVYEDDDRDGDDDYDDDDDDDDDES